MILTYGIDRHDSKVVYAIIYISKCFREVLRGHLSGWKIYSEMCPLEDNVSLAHISLTQKREKQLSRNRRVKKC